MSDYIKREDAIQALCRGEGCGNICRHNIERLPSADVVENVRLSPITTATEGKPIEYVEVVRCKDCKWWDSEEHNCVIRDSYGWDYKPTDYCSYGENAEAQEESEIINARRGEE